MPEKPVKRVDVLGVIDLAEGDPPPFGRCRLLGVQLAWLPQSVAAKLSGALITVEAPDGAESRWKVATAESHCGIRVITLIDATPRDVFPGCIVCL